MKTLIKDRWIAALLSGEYLQHRGSLRNTQGFCAVGVLCELHRQEYSSEWNRPDRRDARYTYLDSVSTLPMVVQEWAGLPAEPLVRVEGQVRFLSDINDEGYTFKAIAKMIGDQL